MGKPGNTGIQRMIRAVGYSAKGLVHAWKYEAAFRQEIALVVVLLPVGLWLGRTPIERTMLIACCVMVLIVELLNTAVETAIDRHGDEQHELSGRAKDLGSAAVLLSLLLAGMVWATIAYQRLVG